MRSISMIFLACAVTVCSPVVAQSQAQETQGQEESERKGIKIDASLFENSMLDPEMFRMLLKDVLGDTEALKEMIFEAIEFANYSKSQSAYHHEFAKVGGSLTFEISDGLFMIRILTKDEHEQVSQMSVDELPGDLKSKQIFAITNVTNDSVSVERGATRIAIPVNRILYFQHGLAPFFR